MKKIFPILLIASLFFSAKSMAQADNKIIIEESKNKSENIYASVETKPDFPGGMTLFYEYISKNFKIPAGFKKSGKIIVQFVVEKDGDLNDIKVLRDLGPQTAKEAIRVLEECPNWIPGKQKGIPVRVLYSLPIQIN